MGKLPSVSEKITQSPIDVLVLPCSWFDGSWMKNPYHIEHSDFFKLKSI